jgi:hypothetical protein
MMEEWTGGFPRLLHASNNPLFQYSIVPFERSEALRPKVGDSA